MVTIHTDMHDAQSIRDRSRSRPFGVGLARAWAVGFASRTSPSRVGRCRVRDFFIDHSTAQRRGSDERGPARRRALWRAASALGPPRRLGLRPALRGVRGLPCARSLDLVSLAFAPTKRADPARFPEWRARDFDLKA